MKTLFLTAFVLMYVTTGLSQTDSCDPDGCWTVTDGTCYAEYNCADMDGASDGIIFQVPCSGTYYFSCKVGDCTSGDCHDCVACAKFVDNNPTIPVILTCSAVTNGSSGCTADCVQGTQSAYLIVGFWYSLQVSLKYCGENGCQGCHCKAKARVYGEAADCTAW